MYKEVLGAKYILINNNLEIKHIKNRHHRML